MAWRIDEQVVRGEIDNRIRGRVTGRLWLAGYEAPMQLELQGNCWRDLAGRRLEFTNPSPQEGFVDNLDLVQRGVVGDITASRKVKVPEIPLNQIGEYYAAKKPFPWHWGNALYLEWFSETHGRIVIESASYELKIVGEAAWEMTEAEEEAQRIANGARLAEFLELLNEEGDEDEGLTDEDEASDEEIQTEEEAEQMLARSDLLNDRIKARLAREGDAADHAQVVDEEIQRLREELGEPEPTPEELERNAAWIAELNRAVEAEEAMEREEEVDFEDSSDDEHPLAQRAHELAINLTDAQMEHAWVPAGASEEHPVADLIEAIMKAAAKLAGALNRHDWPPRKALCASIVVQLKRARVYLDDALRALESCQEQKLLEAAWMGVILVEVVDLARDADEIIAELRARLAGNREET